MADYCWQPHASSTGFQWHADNVSYQQPANLADWTGAFPPPRHTRVVKPRSAGNSPTSAGRRRMTFNQNAMHGVSSQYQSALDAALLASAARNPRPTSWHPASERVRGLSNAPYLLGSASENYPDMDALPNTPMNGLPVYDTGNMVPYSLSAGPVFSPNDYFPLYPETPGAMQFSQQTPSFPMSSPQVEPTPWNVGPGDIDLSALPQTASDRWSLETLSMTNIPPSDTTCPSYASVPSPGELSVLSTPDFLPIQKFEDDSNSAPAESDDKPDVELVGMGLYSHPNDSLEQSQPEIRGKGLKLEETFSPSDDEDDDGIVDVESNTNESERISQTTAPEHMMSMVRQATPSMPKQSSKQALNLFQKPFFFDQGEIDSQAIPAAARPFISPNQSCVTYGYGWI